MASKQAELTVVESPKKQSLIEFMSDKYSMMPDEFRKVIKATCFPKEIQNVTDEMLMTFLACAKEYNLNPLMRELYAFPRPGGGIQVIVGVDGWANIVNVQPNYDGCSFEDTVQNGQLVSVLCRIYRKDRQHPTECIEYMAECKRNVDVWRQWPRRMLRHKAFEQASRLAFGLAGIVTPDEAERAFDKAREIVADARFVDTPISAIADSLPDNDDSRVTHVDTDSGGGNSAGAHPDPDAPIGEDAGRELSEQADSLGLNASQQMRLLKKYNVTGYDELPFGKMEEFIKDMQTLAAFKQT